MKKHMTRNTVEVSSWCPICNRMTPHAVLGGRLAGCKNEHPHPEPKEKVEDKQESLF